MTQTAVQRLVKYQGRPGAIINVDHMPRLLKILLVAGLVFALGAATVWAIWDWRNSVQDFSLAVAFSLVIASTLMLPAFVVYLIRERNIGIAWTKARHFWVGVFSKIFEQV